jgi:uncharacterized protein (UPF0276 family)
MDFFEIVSENFMETGGRPREVLLAIRKRYPVIMHGVSLSVGSTDNLDWDYLKKLKSLMNELGCPLVSDHLCWSGVGGQHLHDLLPLPFTEESLNHVVSRVRQIQDFLEKRILLENVSSYLEFSHSEMTEWEFLREVATLGDCGILLDINNIYVNAFNHSFDPFEYLKAIPRERVGQFHLAGHTDRGTFYFDTHIGPIIDPVWKLYQAALCRFGPVTTLIEWDDQIPPFTDLQAEAARARAMMEQTFGKTKPSLTA